MSSLSPVWTKPSSLNRRSLDPLGLDRIPDRITGNMVVGVTALTTRARYYSFYAWVIKNVLETEQINKFSDFENAFFDRERAYTMACIAHNEETPDSDESHTTIQGYQASIGKWRESNPALSLHGFRHLQNKLGGYGYYYQASIRNLGLTEAEQTKDVLTPLGLKLAESFEKNIKETQYLREFVGQNQLPKDIVYEYGRSACICSLHKTKANDRNILREIILGTNKEAIHLIQHQNRQHTLALMLHIIRTLEQNGVPATEQRFLDTTYFKQFTLNEKAIDYSCPPSLVQTMEKWKMFRAHDYFAYSCETILHIFLKNLDMNRHNGLRYSEFINSFDNPEFIQELFSTLGIKLNATSLRAVTFQQIISAIVRIDSNKTIDSKASKEFDDRCNLSSSVNEQVLQTKLSEELQLKTFNANKVLALSLLILFYIFPRFTWRTETLENTWMWLRERSKNANHSPEGHLILDHGVAIFVHETLKIVTSQFSLFDFLSWFYFEYVIKKEMDIFKEKKGSSVYSRPTSWFSLDQDVYRIERDYEPRFRNSRFNSCISIMSDLNLCKQNKDHHTLTTEGEAILLELIGEK